MNAAQLYTFAADLILLLHVFFVAFVVVGLVLILAGKWQGWSWVHNPCTWPQSASSCCNPGWV